MTNEHCYTCRKEFADNDMVLRFRNLIVHSNTGCAWRNFKAPADWGSNWRIMNCSATEYKPKPRNIILRWIFGERQ